MPSHIFTRVGYWKEFDRVQYGSVRAAKADKEYGDQLHGQDYMVYAYLQLAQDKNARAVIDEMAAGNRRQSRPSPVRSFALAASPARYAMERGDWSGAAALEVRPSKFPHVMAITHFARAVGAARVGQARRGQRRHRQACRVARQAARGEGRLLGRAGRYPMADRERVAALRAKASTTRRSTP